jgi:F-type H+-transporting ATPase subunit O
VETEVNSFMAALKGNAAFESFMMNPTVARSAKTAQLESLLDDKTFSFVSKNLFLTMSANGRIADVEKVVEGYAELMEASRGETKVTITTAEPLSKKAMATVETAVKGMVGKGTKISISTKNDPAILGGLQVLIGDRFLDLSVLSRVQTLTTELEAAEL